MDNCCNPNRADLAQVAHHCPHNGAKGKPVPLITLKSLLLPDALAQLNAHQRYRFCASPDCPIVYFGDDAQTFTTTQIKVPIFAKDKGPDVPVCYCFGWRRGQLQDPSNCHATDEITAHIQAQRCGCEVNNPQGCCCLTNVRSAMEVAVLQP
jgi:hypothetical protein